MNFNQGKKDLAQCFAFLLFSFFFICNYLASIFEDFFCARQNKAYIVLPYFVFPNHFRSFGVSRERTVSRCFFDSGKIVKALFTMIIFFFTEV